MVLLNVFTKIKSLQVSDRVQNLKSGLQFLALLLSPLSREKNPGKFHQEIHEGFVGNIISKLMLAKVQSRETTITFLTRSH